VSGFAGGPKGFHLVDLRVFPKEIRTVAYENLGYETKGNIATITLDRPKVLNALNRALFNDLEAVFLEIAGNVEIRAIILTGAGEKAFAAGADIGELRGANAAEGQQIAARGQAVFDLIESCGKPVVAAVNGFALGGGCELAMACTFRVASATARLGQPEVKLGLIPGYGGSQRLPRLVGKGAALKLLLTAEIISAGEALRIGLVDEVVPAAELLPRAEALSAAIAANAPLAVRSCIETVNAGYDLPLAAGLELEAARFGLACSTEDMAEGTAAFLAKRPPVWTGR
jgi:enoyl-CoA hydratase